MFRSCSTTGHREMIFIAEKTKTVEAIDDAAIAAIYPTIYSDARAAGQRLLLRPSPAFAQHQSQVCNDSPTPDKQRTYDQLY